MKSVLVNNAVGEKIDVLVEGNLNSPISIVFVHGFGKNKDESAGLFVDISSVLREYRVVRFDFTGYGKSEGKQEDTSLVKEASDLNSVLREYVEIAIWALNSLNDFQKAGPILCVSPLECG